MTPKLVLHICCAPDQAWVLKSLGASYELYCFFCNPNIHPLREYDLRREEAERVAALFKTPIAADACEPQAWQDAVRGFEHTPEGGERCMRCFDLRLQRTARFCAAIGWPGFTTVMSMSPHKKTALLDTAGEKAAGHYGVVYERFDFKKKDGFKKSLTLSRELGLYRQNYCGCIFSKQARDARERLRRTGAGGGAR